MAIVGLTSPFRKKTRQKESPVKWWQAVAAGLQLWQGYKARKEAKRQDRLNRADMEKRRQDFMNLEFTNPYAGMKNPYAENIYEDLTVDTQAADYAREQARQSQADVLQSFKGAAGGSGVAGLAQAISGAGTKAAQQSRVSISQQERQNQLMRLKGAEQRRQGAERTDIMQRQGEQMRREQEHQRVASMYGLSMQRQMAGQQSINLATSQIQQGVSGLGTAAADIYGVGGSRDWKKDWGKVKDWYSGLQG